MSSSLFIEADKFCISADSLPHHVLNSPRVSGVSFYFSSPSWNAGWGEGGYIRIFRATGGAAEQCGTDSTPSDGDGCPDGPSSINVCGECAVLSDSSYPYGGRLV